MTNRKTGIFSIPCDQIDLSLLALRTPSPLSVKKMAASLSKRGQPTPIIIADDGKRSILVDGFKRHHAAARLGLDSLTATCLAADPTQAKVMMYLMNRAGSFSMIQEALLVRELVDTEGLSQTEAAGLLDRHKSWVSRRLLMIRRLAPEIIEDLKLELIPPGSAPALARVPPRNQPDFSAAIQINGLSAKEIGRMIELWCKAADPGAKQFVLKSPKQALSIFKEEKQRLASPKKILHSIGKLLASFERRLEAQMQDIDGQTITQLRECLFRIKSDLTVMEKALLKAKS